MKQISILGFGNPVREDDGIGIYVINELKKLNIDASVEIIDMGTSAFEVLFKLKNKDHIILIDAVLNTGEPDGTLYKLPAEAIEGKIKDDPMVFLHSLKWDQALSYARKMLGDDYPKSIDVFLVAIENTRFNTELSETVKQAGDLLVQRIKEELTLSLANSI